MKEERYPCYLHYQVDLHFDLAKFEIVSRLYGGTETMRNLPHVIEDNGIRLAQIVKHEISLIEEYRGMAAGDVGIGQNNIAFGMAADEQGLVSRNDLASGLAVCTPFDS